MTPLRFQFTIRGLLTMLAYLIEWESGRLKRRWNCTSTISWLRSLIHPT